MGNYVPLFYAVYLLIHRVIRVCILNQLTQTKDGITNDNSIDANIVLGGNTWILIIRNKNIMLWGHLKYISICVDNKIMAWRWELYIYIYYSVTFIHIMLIITSFKLLENKLKQFALAFIKIDSVHKLLLVNQWWRNKHHWCVSSWLEGCMRHWGWLSLWCAVPCIGTPLFFVTLSGNLKRVMNDLYTKWKPCHPLGLEMPSSHYARIDMWKKWPLEDISSILDEYFSSFN